MTNGLLSTPREWKNGVTFNFTAGQDLQVEVARRRYYSNRATFWDLLGILQVSYLSHIDFWCKAAEK